MVQGPAGHLGRSPITEDDDTIATFLQDVSVPALMMSVVHLTGDPSILRGPHRPTGIYLNEVQGFMSEPDQAAVRAEALGAIIAYRDSGCVLPPPPGPTLVHEMMNVLVAQEVPDEYVPMLLEELELDGADVRDLHWADGLGRQDREDFHVLVIGAGMSGLLAAIRLQGAGVPFTVVEKNAGPRRDLVGEPLSRLSGGRGQPLLLLFLCAEQPTGRSSSPASPSCRPTSKDACTSSASRTTFASTPRWWGPGGTNGPRPGQSGCAAPTARERRSRPTR